MLFLPSFDGSLTQCYQVPITDDSFIEEEEEFRITLRRIPGVTPSNVRFVVPEATVRIVDNDSKISMHMTFILPLASAEAP